jgi:polygalacturonase
MSHRRRALLLSSVCFPVVASITGAALADPTLPTIGSTTYNVTVSNSAIDGGAVAKAGGTTDNSTVINDFIAYAAAHGGGTVEVPAASSPYMSNKLLLGDNVDLDVLAGATLENLTPKSTFITTNGATHDVEISGGGILDDHATSTSSNNMLSLENITNLEVANVTVENSSHEHLVAEADNDVTINHVTIQDPLKYQSNTDGIDFSGSHFLIENSSIADGDDNIVAKPQNTFCSDITIENDTMTRGHGISIGGQTNDGLNGMTVTNCTLSNTTYGIHFKAGTSNGGLVQNVTVNTLTMTKVEYPIVISSFYNNGSDDFPSTPSASNPFPVVTYNATTPIWNNITVENVTATGANNAALIYGLNATPPNMNLLTFNNINIHGTDQWDMYYAANVDMNNVTVTLTKNEPSFSEFADTFVSGSNAVAAIPIANALVAVPEPASLGLVAGFSMMALWRRRGRAK